MLRKVLHSKIHMATCTRANPDYVGSITIDENLLRETGMRVSDAVLVANCRTGARLETYVFRGEPGLGQIELNGAAAHLVEPGDKLIILHFALLSDEQYATHHPRVLTMNDDNTIAERLSYEPGPEA